MCICYSQLYGVLKKQFCIIYIRYIKKVFKFGKWVFYNGKLQFIPNILVRPAWICTSYRMVPIAIWQMFNEFLIFYIFHEPLGERNNSRIWETSKIFLSIARGKNIAYVNNRNILQNKAYNQINFNFILRAGYIRETGSLLAYLGSSKMSQFWKYFFHYMAKNVPSL